MTLSEQIMSDLAGEIASGAWPPGHRIPFEHELVTRYGCARATVGKAVNALAARGLVERRRKAGTFVAAPRIASAVLQIPDIRAEVEARGLSWRWRRLGIGVRRSDPKSRAAALGVKGPLLEVRGVHVAGGAPFAHEARLISLTEVPAAADEPFTTEAPGAWLLAHAPWSEARHEISAANPELDVAEALRVPARHACLVLERWTWRAGAGITYARQVFPGENFTLAASFAP